MFVVGCCNLFKIQEPGKLKTNAGGVGTPGQFGPVNLLQFIYLFNSFNT